MKKKKRIYSPRLCKCGCNRNVKLYRGAANRFLNHHSSRGVHNAMYGKTLLQEQRQRISERMSGECHPLYGKKHSIETKRKMKEAWKYRILASKETRRRMSISQKRRYSDPLARIAVGASGSNHPRWKGGLSRYPLGCAFQDNEYREDLMERDGFQCLSPLCDDTANVILLHHIDYDNTNNHPWNLITLCTTCHLVRIHRASYARRQWWKNVLQKVMSRRYGYDYETFPIVKKEVNYESRP